MKVVPSNLFVGVESSSCGSQEDKLKGKPNFAVPLVPEEEEDTEKVGGLSCSKRSVAMKIIH